MNWEKYFAEKDERKRWDMLQEDNRLSYDHVDGWLQSSKEAQRLEILEKIGKLSKEWQIKVIEMPFATPRDLYIEYFTEELKKWIEEEK